MSKPCPHCGREVWQAWGTWYPKEVHSGKRHTEERCGFWRELRKTKAESDEWRQRCRTAEGKLKAVIAECQRAERVLPVNDDTHNAHYVLREAIDIARATAQANTNATPGGE